MKATQILFYMSFVNTKENRFIGASLVYAESPMQAMQNAWEIGCNPGGEVMSVIPDFIPDDKWINRLLSREELKEMEQEVTAQKDAGMAKRQVIPPDFDPSAFSGRTLTH
jgi:hypothetical protein